MKDLTENHDDFFAHIGRQGLKWGDGLCENPPEPLPDIALPAGPFQEAHDFQPRTLPGTAEDLRAGLRGLRQKMAPFLRRLAPPMASHRESLRVSQMDWRLVEREGILGWRQWLDSSEGWETISLPHYGGPVGRATTLYRGRIGFPEGFADPTRRIFLRFRGADYRARVFLNGEFVMEHEGFFDPFEADVTALIVPGVNILVVRLDNEDIAFGCAPDGRRINGEKLYAATGPGWDEPGVGWHHCPSGMGLYQDVLFEARPALHIHDLWVRPLTERAELRVTVHNTDTQNRRALLRWNVCGSNFEAQMPQDITFREITAEPGLNFWRLPLDMPEFRWWSPDAPWLYQAQVTLTDPEGKPLDTRVSDFGMRTFEISTSGPVKGHLSFNGQEIRLRGANTMGHEQQCVLRGDQAQLEEDILIAKYAGLNFLRITQRPVQKEIYEVCDRLGMMVQTDLPLFGRVPRIQFAEGVRQAGAMERLIRPHACCIQSSFINEPSPSWVDTTHRHLDRDETMRFLRACAEMTLCENPDRQIKPIDGDYEPPSPGLPDQHCYSGWYPSQSVDLGRLHRGHWMLTKPGWKYACGEFGTEGLDPVDLMQRRYLKDWLPRPGIEDQWTPLSIPYAQTGYLYTSWMDAGEGMADWVKRSQEHQAWATRLMTRAFRRDRRMVSFALHLLIDAFPDGWMKAVVDCERNPKPAFFEYREALSPLLADLRCDRWAWWEGETLTAEAWISHDGLEQKETCSLRFVFELEGEPIASGCVPAEIPSWDSQCLGRISVSLPSVQRRSQGTLRLALCAADGSILSDTRETFSIFPRDAAPFPKMSIPGDQDLPAERFLKDAHSTLCPVEEAQVLVSSHGGDFDRLRDHVEAGATLLLLELPPGEFDFGGSRVTIEKAADGPRQFASRATGHPAVAGFEKNDFRFWFDPAEDSVTALLEDLVIAPDWTILLSAPQTAKRSVLPAAACVERSFGKGRVIICQLRLAGRLTTNPPAELFARRLLSTVVT